MDPKWRIQNMTPKPDEEWAWDEDCAVMVSNYCEVQTRQGINFGCNNGRGNYRVHSTIDKKKHSVQLLAARAFIPNPNGYKYVVKNDPEGPNHTDNLCWVRYPLLHRYKNQVFLRSGKWRAHIDKLYVNIGDFDTRGEALDAYCARIIMPTGRRPNFCGRANPVRI